MKVAIEITRPVFIEWLKAMGATDGRTITISQVDKLMQDEGVKGIVAEDMLFMWQEGNLDLGADIPDELVEALVRVGVNMTGEDAI